MAEYMACGRGLWTWLRTWRVDMACIVHETRVVKVRAFQPLLWVFVFFVEVVESFFEDDCSQRAAALAYYAALSLPALLILLVALGGAFIDPAVVEATIQKQAQDLLSGSAGQQLVQMVHRAGGWASSGPWWAIGLSVVGLLFGATRTFSELQIALNRAWSIETSQGNAVKNFVLKRLFSFAALGAMVVLFLASMVLRAILARFQNFAVAFLPSSWLILFEWFSGHTLGIALGVLFFASLYWLLPDAKVSPKAVLPGALFTAATFEVLNSLLSAYLGKSQFDDIFGQAGSFVVLLTWLYVCAGLFLFGAEFTQVWSRHRGRPPVGGDSKGNSDQDRTSFSETLKRRWNLSPPG